MSGDFRMAVEAVRLVEGRGTLASGTVLGGSIRVGDPVRVVSAGTDIPSAVAALLDLHGHHEVETSGGLVRLGVYLRAVPAEAVADGAVLIGGEPD